jgi:hypothetical protein
MDVTWRIEATATGARVSIDHAFQSRLPGFAPFVDRAFIRPIAGRTLATFKALAEALAETQVRTPSDGGQSDDLVPTRSRA